MHVYSFMHMYALYFEQGVSAIVFVQFSFFRNFKVGKCLIGKSTLTCGMYCNLPSSHMGLVSPRTGW